LATAITYSHEAVLGYPSHAWLCVGELVNAENEMLRSNLMISQTIRQYRLQYMDCIEENFRDLSKVPQILDLIEMITTFHELEKQRLTPETPGLFDQQEG
jgi:hypothetical protein